MILEEFLKSFFNTVIQEFAKKLVNKNNKKIDGSSDKTDINTLNHTNKLNTTEPLPTFETSSRLKNAISIMSQKDKFDQFIVSKIAYNLGLETSTELYDYINSKKEPTFEFLDKFCNFYTVNSDWLKFGTGQPFNVTESWGMYPEYYYEKMIEFNPHYIYFVRDNSETGKAIIILELNDLKYLIIRKTYHISSYVGATGQSQIYSFYKLVKKIKQDRELYNKCRGLIISEELFDDISCGRMYPGYLKQIYNNENNWWDDFTDVNHSYSISENYKLWYGEEFIKAQNIVLYKIKDSFGVSQ